jgi:hypothetical protein
MGVVSQLERNSAPEIAQHKKVTNVTRQLEILALHSLQLADQVAAGRIQFLDAVDLAYDAATWARLPEAIDSSGLITGAITGDDLVQATIAAAFANARNSK